MGFATQGAPDENIDRVTFEYAAVAERDRLARVAFLAQFPPKNPDPDHWRAVVSAAASLEFVRN